MAALQTELWPKQKQGVQPNWFPSEMEKKPGLQRSHIWPSTFSLQLQTPETGLQDGWLPYEPGRLQLQSRQPWGGEEQLP